MKEAIEIYEQLRRPSDVVKCLLKLAKAILRQSASPDDPALQEAGELVEEARHRLQQHNAPSDVVACLTDLGEIRRRQCRYIEAQKLLNEAKAQSAKLGDRLKMAFCLAELGRIKIAQARNESSHEDRYRREGKRLLRKAVSLYRQIRTSDALRNMLCDLTALSQVALNENKLVRAWHILKECRDVSRIIERTDWVEEYQRELKTLGCRILRGRTRTLRDWNEQRKERLKWRWKGNVQRVQNPRSK
jgi:tetratricopeptide (TPR) repeat protein